MKRQTIIFSASVAVLLIIYVLNIFMGSISIPMQEVGDVLCGNEATNPTWEYIILESRIPQATTALLCGMALAVSGLMLQTVFRNPLAGPDILGINSGASLGVAFVTLFFSGTLSAGGLLFSGYLAILIAAFAGSIAVMGLILLIARLVKNNIMLLIAGIMIGYVASSAISLLNYFSTEEGVQNYVLWGMGNFSGVSVHKMPLFATLTVIGIISAVLLIKPLNLLLLGEKYATNIGLNVRRTRYQLLLVTGLLSATVTAYCGPIAFIGIAVPHIARMIMKNDNHRALLPLTVVCGGTVALLCNLISTLPSGSGLIPLNALTPLFGAPVVIYVIIKGRHH